MNSVAKKILKSLLLSATVALVNSANAKKTSLPESLTLGLSSDNQELKEADSKQKIVRDVYKILKNGNAKLIAGHRSHSSHSSHRSSSGGHYSHSSSSYSSGSYSRSTGTSSGTYKSSTTTSDSENSKVANSSTSSDSSSDIDKLGISDVKATPTIPESTTNSSTSGNSTSSSASGKSTSPKNSKISNNSRSVNTKTASKSSSSLGSRKLSYGMSGQDVDLLIKLLTMAGFPPDEKKVSKIGDSYWYSDEITMAIKVFQAFHGIKPTGDLDSKTITELKKYDK